MTMRIDFDERWDPSLFDDEVIIHMDSGLAINRPLGPQVEADFMNRNPNLYAEIVSLRAEQGIEIEDDCWDLAISLHRGDA